MPQKKKSAAGAGSIRKKTVTKNGKPYIYWEARYTEGYDPSTGKQIQRTITGKTQKEVSQKLKAATVSIDNGSYIAPCKMTLGQWLDTWLAEYLNHVKPLTQEMYKNEVKKHIRPALGSIRLDGLNTHAIQQFCNSLSRSGLAPKTVKNIHGVLHSALEQAVAVGFLRENPAKACKLPRFQRPEIHPLEPDQIKLMLQEARKDDYCNLFITAMFTGMRQGELLGLSWSCVDFDTGVITVKQQLQCKDGKYFLETPKNGKTRTILPAPLVMDALRKEQEKQKSEQQAAGSLWNNSMDLVFTDAVGKHLVRRTVVKHFKKITHRAGIPEDARFHDLRHSFAVTSLYAGDDIKTVQANLGHATAQFTLDTYGHVMQRMRHDSANRMQHFYEQLSK